MTEYSVSLVIRTMKLADYLKETKTPKYRFAERIGVQPSVVSDYCKGRYCPRPKIAVAIKRETDGRVTADDFLPVEDEIAQAAQ